jgi:hypothetical protein
MFQNLKQITIDLCQPMIAEKQHMIETKLNYDSRLCTMPKLFVDRTVFSNISSRLLSDDEIDCLAQMI